MARKVLRSIEISSPKTQVDGVNSKTSTVKDLEASTTTNGLCRIEIEIVEEPVARIACQSRNGRRSLELPKDQGPCEKGVIEGTILVIHIRLGEIGETVHGREMAVIHIDQIGMTEIVQDQDHQDGIGTGMIEIVEKGALQGIWTVMRATSAAE